jgi:hypothetical protein
VYQHDSGGGLYPWGSEFTEMNCRHKFVSLRSWGTRYTVSRAASRHQASANDQRPPTLTASQDAGTDTSHCHARRRQLASVRGGCEKIALDTRPPASSHPREGGDAPREARGHARNIDVSVYLDVTAETEVLGGAREEGVLLGLGRAGRLAALDRLGRHLGGGGGLLNLLGRLFEHTHIKALAIRSGREAHGSTREFAGRADTGLPRSSPPKGRSYSGLNTHHFASACHSRMANKRMKAPHLRRSPGANSAG